MGKTYSVKGSKVFFPTSFMITYINTSGLKIWKQRGSLYRISQFEPRIVQRIKVFLLHDHGSVGPLSRAQNLQVSQLYPQKASQTTAEEILLCPKLAKPTVLTSTSERPKTRFQLNFQNGSYCLKKTYFHPSEKWHN